MNNQEIILTDTDRLILNSYKTVLEGLANYLGQGYELVLHSLENLDNSVVCIINGHHTGRKEGAPITDLALSMLKEVSKGQNDYATYFSKNKKGEPLKSSTIAIRGEKGKIIGLLCINFYMNTTILDFLGGLVPDASEAFQYSIKENFFEDSNEIIKNTLEKVKQEVYADQSITTANKNKTIVCTLDNYGIFNIKDSVIKVADLMNISKNTVYMHLRNKNSAD